MTTLLRGTALIDERGQRAGAGGAWVLLDGDGIRATGTDEAPDADTTVDLGDAMLAPGFVDIHVHGGGGHSVDGGLAELEGALAAHRAHGTTRSIVSFVSAPLASLREGIAQVAELTARDPRVLGSHLEGPFLAPARRGAHDESFLRHPDPESVEGLIEAGAGTLRQVTLAPELPGGLEAVARLAQAGVVPAVGHTEADEQTARAAFDAGARLLTHAFNAMPGIGHRAPGPVIAAIDDERITLELVLDGLHVNPHVAKLLWDAAPGRVALITDAMSAAAEADGDYRLGTLNVTVRDGLALLSGTDTIAGSTLTQDVALRQAIAMGATPVAAIAALTTIPVRALGIPGLGLLEPGYPADVVALDPTWNITAVWSLGLPLVE
jgi:N-acetylglucosamine-6-phosphate deacetylase